MSENNNIQCCSNNTNDKVEVRGDHAPAQPKLRRIQPPADIAEAKEDFILCMDMPGLNPNDISVKLDKEILTVEAKSEVEGLPPRIFYRQFRVMNGLDASKCRADYKQGVLTLSLAKPTTAQPQQIKIQSED